MKRALLIVVVGLWAAAAQAQVTPTHITGTFRTPSNQTPVQAGLKSIATIGATAVYGTVDFQPYDALGNKPTRILCGGATYLPQRVRGWIKGDGTLVDNATAAAGVDLVPTIGCTPSGLVMRSTITISPTPDGRIPTLTWTEDKQIPQQASADWGSLAAAGVTAPTYTGYSTVESSGVALFARNIVNFVNGGCADNAGTGVTDCTFTGTGGGGATIQTAGVNNSSQTTLNFQAGSAFDGLTITPSNPSAGNEQFALSGTATKALLPAATVYTDQANTFGAFLQKFQAGTNFRFADTTDPTKLAHFDLSNLTTSTERTVNVPDANSTFAQAKSSTLHQFLTAMSAQGVFTSAQPDYSDLTGVPATFAPTAHNLLSASHGDTTAHAVVRGDLVAGIGAVPTWTAVARGGTNIYPKWNASGDVVPSTLAAAGIGTPTACSNQFVTGFTLNADAAPTSNCAPVAYANVSGTPTLFYQTLQANGTAQTQRPIVNLIQGSNMTVSCVDNSGATKTDCTLTSSSTGSTAFSALTASLNNNAGTFSASGNMWDFSAATLFKLRVGAGCTTSVNGDLCTNSTDGVSHLWTNGADRLLLASTNKGSSGQIPISNGDGTVTVADPVVSWNSATATTAAWTSATTVDTAATASLTSPVNFALVTVTLRATSTMTGGTLNFEADDGSGNFSFPIECDRADSATVENSFALAVTNKAWQCNIAGFSQFRVRLNPVITGTGTANVRITPTTAPVQSEMAVSQAVAGALHATIDAAPANASTNITQFGGSAVATGTGTGGAGIPRVTVSSDSSVTANIGTSGSLALDATLTGGTAKVQGNVASAASDSGNPLKIGGIFNTTQPTVTTGQRVDFQSTARGAQIVATGADAFTVGGTGNFTVVQGTGTNLHMVCDSGCSSSAGFADNAAFTAGTTAINPIGGIFDDTPPTAITTGKAAAARITNNRALHINLRNQAGTELATSGAPLRTDPTGTTTQPISAASLPLPTGAALDASVTGLEVAQASTTSGQKGILELGAVTTSAPSYTTAQSSPLSLTTAGALRGDIATIAGTAPSTAGKLDVKGADGDVFVRQATAANLNATIVGTKTNNNAAPGALNIGDFPALANAATPSWTEGNQVAESVDLSGRLRVRGTAGDNGAAATTDREGVLPAIAQSQLPSAATAGRDVALRTDLNGTQFVGLMPVNITSYHAAKQGLAPAAAATDIAVMPGNATNTVIVTRAQLSCTQTTAGIIDVQLLKRSTADTAGTSAAMTTVPFDSGNSAAVSAPLSYTANPTTGTLVGAIYPMKVAALAPATAGANDVYIWTPKYGQSITLRGTAQQLAINLNGLTLTGGSCDASFDWIETTGL